MSESELYMQDSNESYDLPRWQTHVDPMASSTAASQSPYLYSGAPPPPPPANPQRMQSIHQASPPSSKQPRISQLLEQEQQYSPNLSPYASTGQPQLTRSTSLGASAGGGLAAARLRRHNHPQEDPEGAFTGDNHSMVGPRQQPQLSHTNSYYTSAVGYQAPSMSGSASNPSPASSSNDAYQDMYYNGTASNTPKRLQPGQQPDANSNRGGGRSPLRVPTTPSSASPLDHYSHQNQYSPTTSSYPYGTEQRSHTTPYQSHNRSLSNLKSEQSTSPMQTAYSPATYSSPYSMDSSSPHPPVQSHLNTQGVGMKTSLSNPSTPLSYVPSTTPHGSHYYPHDQPMAVDPRPIPKRPAGFRRVRAAHDLQPKMVDGANAGRRMSQDGTFLSPLRQLTTNIVETYRICNTQFRYESTHNPRRVLTKPSKPSHNDGYDNEDYDYILYVNDWLGSEDGHKYLILDILGQGTFGQVVKCQNMKTHEIVAVKVVKNKPAYFNQSMMEVTILELLNKQCDPNDEHHILRLRDSFIHRSHLCLVFELLSSNLYELIKQNQFQGLSTQLVKVFMAQLLDALTILKDARLIHCDLKPENILLRSLQSPQIKVIDFGSACHERQTVYTYIQSRFYRSPEVLLGMSYTASIDMWSLGCIAVELFLGLPLFPGTSEYNQLTRIIEMLGMPPLSMMNIGKQTNQFFDSFDVYNPHTNTNDKKYRLKSLEQYSREHNTNEQPGKQYFKATSLPEIINQAPMPASKSSRSGHELEKELNNRAAFIDFCQGLLNLNPVTRWTPQQARLHPFITGEKFTKPFVPDDIPPPVSSAPDPKRPYGGLVPSQPKGTRAYTDAATYNHHLAQHQAYTAQAQAQSQAPTYRNPYITSQSSQQQQSTPNSSYNAPPSTEAQPASYPQQTQQPAPPPTQGQPHNQYIANPPSVAHRTLNHQNSTGHMPPNANAQYGSGLPSAHLSTAVPPNPYIPNNARARANTINQMDQAVPPALARLQHMNQDIIGGRNALTPVLNRDDAMREWERRQQGKPAAAQPYPQLEYLQQQAEMAAASGMSWGTAHQQRYPPPPSKLSQAYQPSSMLVDEDPATRRENVMSAVRTAASNVIPSPPQVYTGTTATSGNRYAGNYSQSQPVSAFDSLERRTDIGSMYVPMQPDPYQGYSAQPTTANRHVPVPPPPAQNIGQPSFYGGTTVMSGQVVSAPPQPRNPYLGEGTQVGAQGTKDIRRNVDTWTR